MKIIKTLLNKWPRKKLGKISDISPKQMIDAFSSNPPVQAKSQIEKYYVGLLIHSSGDIGDISIAHDYATFSFSDKDGIHIAANFTKPLSIELATLKQGDEINLVGKVFNVGEKIVVLDDCMLFKDYKEKQKILKETWYQNWWGILILGIIASAFVATLFYFL